MALSKSLRCLIGCFSKGSTAYETLQRRGTVAKAKIAKVLFLIMMNPPFLATWGCGKDLGQFAYLYEVSLPDAVHFDHPRALAFPIPPGEVAEAVRQTCLGCVIPVPETTSTWFEKVMSHAF